MPRLITYDDGSYGLLITAGMREVTTAEDVFEERGLEPTGYAWEALALYLLGADAEPVTFDCEADMFAARCATAAPLEALATRLTRLIEDPAALDAAITAAAPGAGGELG